MRKLVAIATLILLPVAVIVIGFKYALAFIEDHI